MSENLVKVEHMYKSFGPTKALVDVSIEINRGEIRGLIGENGSGKSTVSSIIAGVQPADSGEMFVHGKPYKPKEMIDAQNHRISMIVQELGTISHLSVADNIFIGKEMLFASCGVVSRKKMNAEAKKILAKIGVEDIEPAQSIDQLGFEERKLVEIARAVYSAPEILIVDETTTALSQRGRDIVYKIMRDMAAAGNAILFISHDLEELMQICNTITVLRDGHIIQTLEREEMEIKLMKNLMVGRELSDNYYRSDYDGSYSEEVVLRAQQLTVEPVLENFDLELHRGEILGIGGLSDCGMHELGKALFGAATLITGSVTFCPKNIAITDSAVAIDNKIGYVSKNRDQEALIINASIEENIVLPSLRMLRNKYRMISPKLEKKMTRAQIEALRIKCQNENQIANDLSGGNKQKIVFGKWLANESEIFILDCPTRGIDVGVKSFMYSLIYQFKKDGKSVILISEELPELIGMCDRILILKDGGLSGTFTRSPGLREEDIIGSII